MPGSRRVSHDHLGTTMIRFLPATFLAASIACAPALALAQAADQGRSTLSSSAVWAG